MIIYNDILSKELLESCLAKLNSLVTEKVWGNSSFVWGKDIQDCVEGVVTSANFSTEMHDKINAELNPYFSDLGGNYYEDGVKMELNELQYQYLIWNRGSSISTHTDKMYIFGATIYLNFKWKPEWGGLFVWQEDLEEPAFDNNRELHALCPKQNMMVINNRREPHLVTPVSPYATEPRITIQIWGKHASICCDPHPLPSQWSSDNPRRFPLGDQH